MTVQEYVGLFGVECLRLITIAYSEKREDTKAEYEEFSAEEDICNIADFIAPFDGGLLFSVKNEGLKEHLLNEWNENRQAFIIPSYAYDSGLLETLCNRDRVFVVPLEVFSKIYKAYMSAVV